MHAPYDRGRTNSSAPTALGSAAAQRNPLLLFLFSGLLLLRFEARKLTVLLLFQEPPRIRPEPA